MASSVGGFGGPLWRVWSAYERQLEKRPILTQMATSTVLWTGGDLLAQRFEASEAARSSSSAAAAAAAAAAEGGRKKKAKGGSAPPPPPPAIALPAADWRRALLTGGFGATFVAPIGHFWYPMIDALCRRAFPGGGAAFVGAKVLLDTAAMGPFYVAAYFAYGTALIDQTPAKEKLGDLRRKLRVDFVPTLAAEVTVWPVIQAVNFSVVPLRHQLLVVNFATILDAAFMSWARTQDNWLPRLLAKLGVGGGAQAAAAAALAPLEQRQQQPEQQQRRRQPRRRPREQQQQQQQQLGAGCGGGLAALPLPPRLQ